MLACRVMIAACAGALLAAPSAAAAEPPVAKPTVRTGAWIAVMAKPAPVRSAPGSQRVVGRAEAVNPIDGTRERLMVLAARTDRDGRRWLRVRLPKRPNTSAGWLPADNARLEHTAWAVRVDRRARRATVFRDGAVVRRLRVVVGKPSTPTPRGLFAIYAQRASAPGSFIGSWILHLTAHSNVLDDYGGGEGRVALHGRGGASLLDPLGSAASHGCVRMLNRSIAWLHARVPNGAPVFVR